MSYPLTRLRLPLVIALLTLFAACGEAEHDNQHDHHDHADALRIEISTLPGESLLAVWTDLDGWADPDGTPIDVLPAPVEVDGAHQDLTVSGPPASLAVRIIDGDSDPLDLTPLAIDEDAPFERTCNDYSVRYYVEDENVLFWPPVAHPESNREQPGSTFVALDAGEYGEVFQCDSVQLYPRQVGTTSLRFLTWHGNHADVNTDSIEVVVVDAE